MNDRRIITVKIEKAFQNLLRPFLQCSQINMLMFLPVSKLRKSSIDTKSSQKSQNKTNTEAERDSLAQRSRGENFSNEVDVLALGVNPRVVKLNYILMLQSLEQMNFRIKSLEIFRVTQHIRQLYLIPSHFNTFQFIKRSISTFPFHC